MKNIASKGILSGMFIALGGFISAMAMTNVSDLGLAKVLAGLAFSAGLIMSILANAALYTGSVMKLYTYNGNLFKFLSKIWFWNLIGALAVICVLMTTQGPVINTIQTIATTKCNLTLIDMFNRAIYCNILVCLAVAFSKKAKSAVDLIVTVTIPVSVFVICGFEHSVANMFYLPFAKLAGAGITWVQIVTNLTIVTIGNFIGGILVASYEQLLIREDKL